jgi:ABC-2 type transport system ATP-binding protein
MTNRIRRNEKPVRINSGASAITARAVHKSFGEHHVLDGVDLTVAEGTIFSLLGPNGAGKTTMVHILSTLIRADAGDICIGGYDVASDPDAVRSVIGVTGQFSAVDNLLTGAENLRLMADLRHLERGTGQRRIGKLLERFDLTAAAGKPLSTYSGGMRRRLDLAMTLVGSPSVIFLDEPTTGLDPRSRRTMWQIIRELAADGVTILLTTQYLDEADQLADQVAVLDRGQIVAEGTPAELKRRIPGGHVRLHFLELVALHSAAGMLSHASADDDQLTLQVPGADSAASLRRVLNELDHAGIDVEHVSIHTPDLDDVFFAVTGHASPQPAAQEAARQEEKALQR